jgi:threonine/homoserine/homoserine lactone efflux protein
MMFISEQFLVLASAHFLALLKPGPDFFILVGNTARNGVRSGLGAAVGIAVANAAYIAAALTGFNLLTGSSLVYAFVRLLGAVFLGWLGWIFLRSARAGVDLRLADSADKHRGFGAGALAGLLSAGLNPLNGLFYFGLFSLVVARGTSSTLRIFYGVWMFAVVLGWDVLLVLCLRAGPALELLHRYRRKIEGFAGVCLLGLAVFIVASALWAVLNGSGGHAKFERTLKMTLVSESGEICEVGKRMTAPQQHTRLIDPTIELICMRGKPEFAPE